MCTYKPLIRTRRIKDFYKPTKITKIRSVAVHKEKKKNFFLLKL